MPIMFESRAKGVTPLASVNSLMFKSRLKTKVELVPWSTGADEEIKAMIDAYHAGRLSLADIQSVWSIGDERVVNLSAMAATGVDESHVAQSQIFVIMNWGGKELSDGTTCLAIVGQKDILANSGGQMEGGKMNLTETNTGGWNNSARRSWCNNVYKNALPSDFRNIFREFKNVTADGAGYTTATSLDYFALPAEKEVFGTNTRANASAEASLSQFAYYAIPGTRIKGRGGVFWWERSPVSGDSTRFCGVTLAGNVGYNYANRNTGLVPFGCI